MIAFLLMVSSAWAVCPVTTAANAGVGSLRAAINTCPAGDTITFSVPQVNITSQLPVITTTGLTIDGGGTVQIDGVGQASGDGLILDGDNITVQGLHVGRFPGVGVDVVGGSGVVVGGTGLAENAITRNDGPGIRVSGATNVAIDGNRVGLRFDDTAAGNCQAAGSCGGVEVLASASTVTVANNVISANLGDGLRVHSLGATVSGNLVGLSASGTLDRGNSGDGVLISGTPASPATGAVLYYNVISGNGGRGVHLAAYSGSATLTANGVGVDITGQPLGNDLHGIMLASDSNLVQGTFLAPTVIAANGRSGIRMASYGNVVEGVHVGVDSGSTATSLGNAEYGIHVSANGGTGHTIGGALAPTTVVSGNHLGGIWIDAAEVDVVNTVVGLADDELTPVPNGTDPGGPSTDVFGGIWITAAVSGTQAAPTVLDSRVSGNEGHGIWVFGGLHTEDTQGVVVERNEVGLASGGTSAGNAGDGIRVEGAQGVDVIDNTVAGNSAVGVRLTASTTRSVLRAVVEGNLIGDPADSFGNGDTGVLIDAGIGALAASRNRVVDNIIHHSGGYGVYSANGAAHNEVSENTFYDNDKCPLTSDADSNLGGAWPAPEVVSVSGGVVELSVDSVAPPFPLDRVEVYVGMEGDATFEGVATYDAVSDTYKLTGSSATGVDDARGVAIATTGNTSPLTPLVGDGCKGELCAQVDALPDDYCTFTYWDGNACVEHVRPDGYPCDDGDVNTGISRFGAPFDYVAPFVGDAPDHCLSGVCQGGTPTTDPMDCPFATNCNVAVRDAVKNQCTYEADCTNTWCDVDNLGNDGACDDCAGVCLGAWHDDDNDEIPDEWEVADPVLGDLRDWDCDGTVDTDYPEGGSTSERNVYLFIAWMSETCPEPPYSDAQLVGIHHHRPDQGMLADLETIFDDGGQNWDNTDIVVTITEQCIPHYTQMSGDYRNNLDPDCDDLRDHVSIRDLKAWYFAPWRRGIYSFGVMGHGAPEGIGSITPNQQADGVCTASTGVAAGEIYGDDFRVFYQNEWDPADPNLPPANRRQETSSLIHEWGHNHGWGHGGHPSYGLDQTDRNSKPNYQSRMNYKYRAMEHESGTSMIDFSHEAEPFDIDESSVDEIGPGVFSSIMPVGDRRAVEWGCDGIYQPAFPDGGPIDFSCDGAFDTGLQVELDNESGFQVLKGADDFETLEFAKYCAGDTDWDDDRVAAENDSPFTAPAALVEATVDLVPGCATNEVPLDDIAPIQLVLYGSAALDVGTLRPAWFSLSGASARRKLRTDVDSDGHDDVRLWFRASDMPLLHGGSQSMLFNARSEEHVVYWATPSAAPGTYGDSDGDRVIDPCDACPGTAPDTVVDVTGCP